MTAISAGFLVPVGARVLQAPINASASASDSTSVGRRRRRGLVAVAVTRRDGELVHVRVAGLVL